VARSFSSLSFYPGVEIEPTFFLVVHCDQGDLPSPSPSHFFPPFSHEQQIATCFFLSLMGSNLCDSCFWLFTSFPPFSPFSSMLAPDLPPSFSSSSGFVFFFSPLLENCAQSHQCSLPSPLILAKGRRHQVSFFLPLDMASPPFPFRNL